MPIVAFIAVHLVGIVLFACAVLVLVAAPPGAAPPQNDVFGFDTIPPVMDGDLPPIRRYTARDGEQLACRFYDSTASQTLIFVHGSSYHGRSYHRLAASLSANGVAGVVLPNLRGHFLSGRHRGDVEYIGQLEDDLADLIVDLRTQGITGPIVLGGHSSGGGLVTRFAGGPYAREVARFLMLSPVIPTSKTLREGSAGGWARLNMKRLIGLLILNTVGVRGFNALPVIEFNKPLALWDGTETLTYSFRLNASYHPRYRYAEDMRGFESRAAIFIGADDEAVDAQRLRAVVKEASPDTLFQMLPDVDHFGIFTDPVAHRAIAHWLAQR